jgi:hypothetical protein
MLKNNEFVMTKEESQPNGNLLTPEEKRACKQIVMGEAPHRQHAQALLAIDAGYTQSEAAMKSGLTKGQVRYWLAKFRQIRLEIFPERILVEKSLELKPDFMVATGDLTLQMEEGGAPPTKKKGKKKGKKKKADKGKPKNDVKGKKKTKTKTRKGKKRKNK